MYVVNPTEGCPQWLYHLTVTIAKNMSLCNRNEELGEVRQTGRQRNKTGHPVCLAYIIHRA